MKKLSILTNIIIATMALTLIIASKATAASASEISRKEALLAQSGFKVETVTTPKQKQEVNRLAQGRVTAATYKGKLVYLFPTAAKDKFYFGHQKQYNAYMKALASAQKASQPAR